MEIRSLQMENFKWDFLRAKQQQKASVLESGAEGENEYIQRFHIYRYFPELISQGFISSIAFRFLEGD